MEPTTQPSCESCGMPIDEASTSKKDGRYCGYCQNQDTGDLATHEQVRAGSIDAAVRLMGKTEAEATAMADAAMPNLPRWKQG